MNKWVVIVGNKISELIKFRSDTSIHNANLFAKNWFLAY